MTDVQKQWIKRILIGGFVGLALMAAGVVCIGSITLSGGRPDYRHLQWVTHGAEAFFGSEGLALAAQCAVTFALGASVGVATLPFDDYGPALAARSLLHFAVTGGLVLLLGWLLELVGPSPAAVLLLLGLYTFLYLTVWLVRWLGWRAELDDLRSALDLPAPSPSCLNGRESLPSALLLAGFFLLLRPLAEVLDAPDVPVLRALLLPWLAYPFVALLTGWASGLARGLCPLVPLTAFVSFLPNLLWPHVPYDWQQGVVYALLALGANLLAAVVRRWRRRGEERGGLR